MNYIMDDQTQGLIKVTPDEIEEYICNTQTKKLTHEQTTESGQTK